MHAYAVPRLTVLSACPQPAAPSDDTLDRPRERLLSQGPDQIDDAELLAVVLGTGVRGTSATALAGRLLMEFGGLAGLARASPHALTDTAGIGLAQAARVVAAIAVGVRAVARCRRQQGGLHCAGDVHRRMWPRLSGYDQELFFVLSIDACNAVIAEHQIARGHLTGVQIHPRDVFHPLVAARAAAAVCVHNHPTGDPTPSDDDIVVTQRLKDAGELMGIPLLDHIIVSERGFTSIAEWTVGLGRDGRPYDPLRRPRPPNATPDDDLDDDVDRVSPPRRPPAAPAEAPQPAALPGASPPVPPARPPGVPPARGPS